MALVTRRLWFQISPPVRISVTLEKVSAETIACALFYISLLQRPNHFHREAQARRGEEPEVDPEQLQGLDNEYGLLAGTTDEADEEEADDIYEQVDENMDTRQRARRFANTFDATPPCVLTDPSTAKSRIKIPCRATEATRQFVDFKRGLVGRLNGRCVALDFQLTCVYADRES